MSTIKDRIQAFIEASSDPAFLRSEFSSLGSRSGVNRALKALVDDGSLIRVGYGAYVLGAEGLPAVEMDLAALDILGKLGAAPTYGGRIWREWMEGRTTQIPAKPTITVRRRVIRKIGFRNLVYRYEYWKDGQ